MSEHNSEQVRISRVKIDEEVQSRVQINQETVLEYADLYGAKVWLPAVTVFYDGDAYWLAEP